LEENNRYRNNGPLNERQARHGLLLPRVKPKSFDNRNELAINLPIAVDVTVDPRNEQET